MSGNWRSWGNLIDSKLDASSRWHSSRTNLVQTPDRIGDFLISKLRTANQSSNDEEVVAEWGRDLHDRLAVYEQENRLLIKLANTGNALQVLERAIKSTLDVLNIVDTQVETEWTQELRNEREERVELYTHLLGNEDQFVFEIGDEDQQLEVLTLMKHGVEKYLDVLTSLELDLISAVYNAMVRRGNIVVGAIPDWFASSERNWSGAVKSTVDDGEEACLRQVDIWVKLHHPHVRKLYGACHVGVACVIHELTVSRYEGISPWWYMYGCALGLQYVHERGLAHNNLAFANLHSTYEFKGMLSGSGLVRVNNMNGTRGTPSVEADVLAFGFAMFEYLVDCFSVDNSELDVFEREQRLPDHRPSYFSEAQWNLLVGMCADIPAERTSTIEVVHVLESIHQEAHDDLWGDEDELSVTPQFVDNVQSYVIPDAGETISEVLRSAGELCDEVGDFVHVNRPVYNRLNDVRQQLVATMDFVSTELVEDFSTILWRFFLQLEERSQDDFSGVATLCAATSIANRNYGLHHDIDRLLLSTPLLLSSSPVHRWQPTWEQTSEWQRKALKACLENSLEFISGIESESGKAEALALLTFEAENGAEVRTAVTTGVTKLPRWLIPPHQVELGRHLSDGSFGAVYLGKWFNTDVVVKQVLTNQSDRENREQFFHEVNLWASLNHDNLIKLYGACHEGQPFFVCERANQSTLIKYLEGQRHFPAWRSIWEAAKGLQYLHERGVVHGDLKGNNILVCDGTAKLADFGLSVFANTINPAGGAGALGAIRWKAPECLAGSGPTFASDIYSFAMCIIEAISGDFPWGKSIPDSAVEFNVLQKRMLPPRPKDFSDAQWDLITRMSSFEPRKRPSAPALVHLLWKFA
ncbi:hypothetical protein PRIC1_008400 [Phytophthora ramorum]